MRLEFDVFENNRALKSAYTPECLRQKPTVLTHAASLRNSTNIMSIELTWLLLLFHK